MAKIIRFREAEMLVAFFPFSAKVADKAVILQADCDDLEKSIRWGYIRHADQIKGDFEALRESFEANLPAQTNGLISTLEDAVKWFVDRLGDTAFVRVDWPVSRIQFHLPISDKFKQMFDSDTGWLDEAHTVSSALKALFITLEDLRKIQIHKSITLHDVLRFQRVGKFVCEAFEEYAHRNKLHNSPIYLRSIVGHLPEASAFTIARELCGIEKPEDLYELLCANEQFTGVFDVLYRPVFRFGGEYLFPGGIIAYSNIMRNALHAAKFRFDSTESVDPITERLVRTFNRVGVKAISRVDYSFAGQKGEVDVLVVIGDQLFAFECKNSLHPCNTHELRQSYGYAINGFEQLGKLRRLFERPDFAHYMREKTGLAMQNITGLTTCVVTGNRMFTGYEVNGHAVRNVYEIENAIMGGAAQFSFAKDLLHPNGEYETFRFRFWNGKQLEANDLIDYIQRDSLHQIAFRAMKSSVQVIPFGRRELRFKSFLLDVQDFAEELRRHARVEIAPSSEPL
ncbi:MAG: hypothetical protein EPO07_03275 [Verrucomicrobia bacterium]|nr:MAG: hypothetical protein EPO07_03275 [Verrucomicrobiota bacterium]